MASSPRFVHLGGGDLSMILSRLTLLRKRGGKMDAEKLWFDDVELDRLKARDISDRRIRHSNRNSLQRAKRYKLTLEFLTHSLDHVIGKLQPQEPPEEPRITIESLPNELLSYIVDLSCDRDKQEHFTISCVSRRFRELAIWNKSLWTFLSSAYSLEFCNLHVARSWPRGLIIELSYCDLSSTATRINEGLDVTPCRCMAFLTNVIQHVHRWEEFSIHAFVTQIHYFYNRLTAGQIRYILADLTLPKLCKLKTDFSRFGVCPEQEAIETWTMPRLQTLICTDLNRRIINNTWIYQGQLKLLDLTVTDFHTHGNRPGQLLMSLGGMGVSHAEEISITFEESLIVHSDVTVLAPGKTNLRGVRSLSLTFNDTTTDITEYLFTPVLETLTIVLHNEHMAFDRMMSAEDIVSDYDGLFANVLVPFVGAPRLKVIKIHLIGHRRVHEALLLEALKESLVEICVGWTERWNPTGSDGRQFDLNGDGELKTLFFAKASRRRFVEY